MRIFITIGFLINLWAFSSQVFSQNAIRGSEILQMREVFTSKESKISYVHAKDNINEIGLLFSGLFLFYKNFISSQDSQSCSFSPSCSEFGMEAVKKQGVITGILNTVDRLTRCHGFSAEKYQRDPHTHLLIDPL
jgi:uncharacterized protein